MRSDIKIGFIGVGNMASAMIGGMISGGTEYKNILLFDINSDKTEKFATNGAVVCNTPAELYAGSDAIVLSVKPQNFPEVLAELAKVKKDTDSRKLYITIAAGILTDTVSEALGGAPVVRALPNTPMLIGKGVSAICRNKLVTDDEFDFADSIFSESSEVIRIDESEMNRIISVTSSSPAYVFLFIKALIDGAKAQGLDGDALKVAACEAVAGSALMLAGSELSAEELISMVCSKGGTTERAVAELKANKFEETVISAMLKCTDRANELGSIGKK